MKGIGIKTNHAVIKRESSKFFIEPLDEGASQNLFVNGEMVKEKISL